MIFEKRFIFPIPSCSTDRFQLPGVEVEDVNFVADDETLLHGMYFPNQDARFHLLYCHGNADCVARLGLYADALRRRLGCSVFVFDYRGYGKSQGSPNELGVLADGQAARAWLGQRTDTDPNRIVAMGRSLGGAVAIDLAIDGGVGALLIESTFTSIPDVATKLFPRWLPIHRFLTTQLNSLEKIELYTGPLFVSHGDADELVPFRHGELLFERAVGSKRFFQIPGGTHNDPQPADYFEQVEEFLERQVVPRSVA